MNNLGIIAYTLFLFALMRVKLYFSNPAVAIQVSFH